MILMLIENQMFLKGFIIIQFKHFWGNLNIELILAPGCEFLSAKCIQHSVKNVQIRIFFLDRIFPHSDWIRRFTEYIHIQSKCGKIRTRKTPYLDTFHAVSLWITLAVPPLNWIDQSLKRRPWVHTLLV